MDNSGAMTASEPITIVFQTEDVMIADVDLDGELTALDMDAFNAVVADPAAATYAARVAADANLDGQVDDNDTCAVMVALGLSNGFVRGDANTDTAVNLSDALAMLNVLFLGGQPPVLAAALDANADSQFGLVDPLYVLNYLFSGGTAPAAPFPLAGCP